MTVRPWVAQEIARSLAEVLTGCLGWMLVAPVAWLMPRRADWIAVIGRDDGQFVDNSKYFFIQAQELLRPDIRVAFITERDEVRREIAGEGGEACRFPSPAAVWFLMRAGLTVVDSNEWRHRLRRFLLHGTKLVQLWHGVGNKRIEQDKLRHEVEGRRWMSSRALMLARRIKHALTGRQVRFHLVACTSRFYLEQVFRPAFASRHFLISGYPRNCFGRLSGTAERLAWKNVDPEILVMFREWLNAKRKIVLIAPTFRDSRETPVGLDADTISVLDHWCEARRVEMLFKFHPHERNVRQVRGKHIHVIRPDADLYPLMPSASALVTDYSSIYMDFLWLDRPVLFLVPDIDEYLHNDRQFQFDFEAMTPGPKVKTWKELCAALEAAWNRDDWRMERERLRSLAFDDLPQIEATEKVLRFASDRGWIPADALGK